MTQQYDEQNVSEKRDESSTDQNTSDSSNLNDLVGQSRRSTREADEALQQAGQGGQPGDQPVQKKDQQNAKGQNANGGTDREANSDSDDYQKNIANPDAAQGSSSDGDTAS